MHEIHLNRFKKRIPASLKHIPPAVYIYTITRPFRELQGNHKYDPCKKNI
jgi:hypothetical protein